MKYIYLIILIVSFPVFADKSGGTALVTSDFDPEAYLSDFTKCNGDSYLVYESNGGVVTRWCHCPDGQYQSFKSTFCVNDSPPPSCDDVANSTFIINNYISSNPAPSSFCGDGDPKCHGDLTNSFTLDGVTTATYTLSGESCTTSNTEPPTPVSCPDGSTQYSLDDCPAIPDYPNCIDQLGFCTDSGFCEGTFGPEATSQCYQCPDGNAVFSALDCLPDTVSCDDGSTADTLADCPLLDDPDNPDPDNPVPDPDSPDPDNPVPDPDSPDSDNPVPETEPQKSDCELDPESPLCNDFTGSLLPTETGTFGNEAQTMLDSVNNDYSNLVNTIKTEINSTLSFNLSSSSTATLPVIPVGTIHGVEIKYDFQRFTPQLINLGNIFIFIAYMTAFTIVLGKK